MASLASPCIKSRHPSLALPPPRPLVVLLPSALIALPIMLRALLRPGLEVYDQRDETLFHLPTIQGFARALPLPDLSAL